MFFGIAGLRLRRGRSEKDSDELAGIAAGESVVAGAKQNTEIAGRGRDSAVELPPEQALVEAVWAAGSAWSEARQRGKMFEPRQARGVSATRFGLMNMVDDATWTTRNPLGEAETIWAAVGALRGWIEQYGVPRALYTDWKNVYKTAPTPLQQKRGETPLTQFQGMCERLGIQIIAASSPQAKGRVERNNGVQQDRLAKKLRRRGIRT